MIIADIGSNHRNDLMYAEQQIIAAKDCGADAVKFQLFTYKELYGKEGKLPYQLNPQWILPLRQISDRCQIEFMCSAFSVEGIEMIDPFVERHKLASPEISHHDMIEALARTNKPVIVSDGCAMPGDIDLIKSKIKDVKVLKCVSKYPAHPLDYDFTGEIEGISDHTAGTSIVIPAKECGAKIFEVHFDCFESNSKPPTADSCVSLGYTEFKRYCALVKSGDPEPVDKTTYRRIKTDNGYFRPSGRTP